MRKAFVLLSGGMDSTTCLYIAINEYAPSQLEAANALNGRFASVDWVEAISVDYGQRHKKEFDYARSTCEALGIKHSVLNIRGILDGAGIMLTDASVAIPDIAYSDIKGVSPTFIPYRNGTLLSLITAHAQKWVNKQIKSLVEEGWTDTAAAHQMRDAAGIYFGAHADDALSWAYPDCTPEWIGAQANAIYIGTYFTCRLHTPIMWATKAEIARKGTDLGVPFGNTWSCYKGEELHCGICPTCRSRKDAFRIAGLEDPTKYAA